ncbi:HipA N-terminal domain-containing protein [Billgrantia endophytica]|uniref:HipA N-terminal domain-containing protein n=1 Tax=Billgrantia endophytica TaxID=2033802 RepID=UPI0013FDA721|nr:HipA N-terminal domain-containing protein [Halomonas endophytica]
MTRQQDVLHVWRNEQHVGTLWRGDDGRLMGFEYDDAWQTTGHAISHSLPLSQRIWRPEEQCAHRWFGNLPPEEQARAALIKRLGIPDDDFSLLAAIGGGCAGALTILPRGQTPPSREQSSQGQGDYRALELDRLGQWAAFRERYADDPARRPRLSLADGRSLRRTIWSVTSCSATTPSWPSRWASGSTRCSCCRETGKPSPGNAVSATPFVKRQIQDMAATLADLADAPSLQQALQHAGLKDNGWVRLQQQRQHIHKQCRRAERW